METLDRLRRRIEVSESLREIVRTMKVVAAATIRQYERAAEAAGGYGETVELALLAILSRGVVPRPAPRRGGRAVIVFGSDHGLCGRFNEALLEEVAGEVPRDVPTLAVGVRMAEALEGMGFSVEECFFVPGSVEGITLTVEEILEQILSWRAHGIETIDLYYNFPERRGHFRPEKRRLLPVESTLYGRFRKGRWMGPTLPLFREEPKRLFAALLRQFLFVALYRALADSLASEQGQRLLAMQRAEKNISERLEELRRAYHQLRQERITSEVLEVVGGFEALRSTAGQGTRQAGEEP